MKDPPIVGTSSSLPYALDLELVGIKVYLREEEVVAGMAVALAGVEGQRHHPVMAGVEERDGGGLLAVMPQVKVERYRHPRVHPLSWRKIFATSSSSTVHASCAKPL